MSLWRSYLGLKPRTRLFLGLGLISWAAIGIFLTDNAAPKLGMAATDEDRERLTKLLPKVTVVDSPSSADDRK